MRGFLLLAFIAVVFSGCSPRYVVQNQYLPATDEAFVPCVKVCDSLRLSCQKDEDLVLNSCKDSAYARAKDLHDMQMLKYEKEYRRYLHEVNVYEAKERIWRDRNELLYKDYGYFDQSCKKNSDKYACKRVGELQKSLHAHLGEKPSHPQMPDKPLFKSYLDAELLMCKDEKRCEKNYDRCYISCGGEIIPKKICISNCD